MGTVEEIAKAMEQLPPDKLAEFNAWYEKFSAALFDAKIERDCAQWQHAATICRGIENITFRSASLTLFLLADTQS